jgi:hypothetical protein
MRTEEEIRQELERLEKDVKSTFSTEVRGWMRGQIVILMWVLEISDNNKQTK